ncbi:hypothetical protein [Clostridium ljungdahlii]|uniref:Uncharacterized protein n=1 Tax=Clostridium ljungdahlii (strain ATCC 55383 / DSM 13528 / PETC) TaxID=748727 RepID=D8GI41_CLOLD|nr:hypothetical protein [Clostridium ljungdahlii]ADK14903.1 hypothetical protein CLJU_c18410 [Clostridium ljungdahlii DSM 13528]OAA87898.1 hypothetical protein WX45_03382 [Clostridium ljungdahlii DSM 13528]
MNKKKAALGLIISALVGSSIYTYNQNYITEQDQENAAQQQSGCTSPFVYYPNSFFKGYKVSNGGKSNVDFYGWHSWTNSTSGVVSPYTSSNISSIKTSNGGVTSSSDHISTSGYSGVHAGSVAG